MNDKEQTIHFTITLPESLRQEMKEFPEVNWSGVATRAFRKQIEAQKIVRQFAEKGISDEEAIKRGLSLEHQYQFQGMKVLKNH